MPRWLSLGVSSLCPYLEFDIAAIIALFLLKHWLFFVCFFVRPLHLFAPDEPCTYCFAEKPPCPGELEHKAAAMSCKAKHTGSLNPHCGRALSTPKPATFLIMLWLEGSTNGQISSSFSALLPHQMTFSVSPNWLTTAMPMMILRQGASASWFGWSSGHRRSQRLNRACPGDCAWRLKDWD